MIVFVIFILF